MKSLPLIAGFVFILTACGTNTSHQSSCGDGIVDIGEECDGEENIPSCAELGYYEGSPGCTDQCTLDYSPCTGGGGCGDGQINANFDEECDGANLGEETCHSVNPVYHEGYGALTCSDTCKFVESGCVACGDGALNGPESCDGTDFGGETCHSVDPVYHEGYGALSCSDTCERSEEGCVFCGDGQVNGPETCDGSDFAGQLTCGEMGYAGGQPTCVGGCDSVDYSSCATWVKVSNSYQHTCALNSEGEVYCWGEGGYGRLGNGSQNDQLTPVKVTGLPGRALDVACGLEHTCAVVEPGYIYCWGRNDKYQLGVDDVSQSLTPVPVSTGYSDFTSVGAGQGFSCGINAGQVFCWGDANHGRLGNCVTEGLYHTPQSVQLHCSMIMDFFLNAASLSVGRNHACARQVSGMGWLLRCWGLNNSGQLGVSTSPYNESSEALRVQYVYTITPVDFPGDVVTTGLTHSCGVNYSAGDALYCWGYNSVGQIAKDPGTTPQAEQAEPVYISRGLMTQVEKLRSGSNHNCALLTTGELFCWGHNAKGQLGATTAGSYSYEPVEPTQISTPLDLFLGYECTFSLSPEGRLFAFGANSTGQLGIGTTTDTETPTMITIP